MLLMGIYEFIINQRIRMSDKKVLIGFSILSIFTMGIGFYKALNSKQENNKQDTQQVEKQEDLINKQLDKLNTLQALLSDKADNLELKYLKNAPHILAVDCLKEILQFTANIIDSEELQSIYATNRGARRSCFSSVKRSLGLGINQHLQTYYRFACTFQEQLQYLIQKSQKDFVVFLNIQYTVITESIDFHICQADSHFTQWVKQWSLRIKEALREKLPLYQHPVLPSKILEIAEYQIKLLTKQTQNLKKSIKDLKLETEDEQQAIPTFLQVFLEDVIDQEFNIEIQQTNLATQDLTQELQEKLHILSELQASVLNSLLQEEEIAVSEEDQSLQRQNQ